MAARALRRFADHRGIGARLKPAQGAAPFDQLPARQAQWRCGRRRGDAPQWIFAGKEWVRLLANAEPQISSLRFGYGIAADFRRGCGYASLRAGQAQCELAVVPRT